MCLRLGTVGFDGDLKLYGPNGALLKTAASGTDAELDLTATNSGTFTALVSSYSAGGSGTYVLHLAQFPEAFIVPAGDEGGPMTNGGNYAGTITLGDLDMWSFTANAGDNIVLRLGTVGFYGNLQPVWAERRVAEHGRRRHGCRIDLHRHQQRHLHGAGQQLTLRAAPAPTCCIWPSFPRRLLCLRVMKAGP